MFRKLVVTWLIYFLSRGLYSANENALSKEEYDGLLAGLWQNPAFRKYAADRDAKLIFAMAGGEGMAPEPRDAYVMHTGQRVELLLLASEAKKAHLRTVKSLEEKNALESARKQVST